ncbi:MAG: substrate-binding domain-containing protein [Spirochaetia bacterium]
MKRYPSKVVIVLLATVLVLVLAGTVGAEAKKHYYYIGALNSHPYFLDTWLGIDYTKKALNVDITVLGPNDYDTAKEGAAIEQTIPKKPDGIMVPLWDSAPVPAIKKAMAAGIPVIAVYTTVPDSGTLSYVGLDNYQAGYDTGRELIKRGGTSGKLGIIMNAGASNTEAKKAGALAALKDTKWEVVVQAEDKANGETAIEAAKSMFNSHPEITGVLGLDSSSGTGIGRAIEELGLQNKKMTIIVHDREDVTLDYIDKGIIGATVEAKTAIAPYLAVLLMQDYNSRKQAKDVPISINNWDSGVKSIPEFVYVGAVIIDKSNVKNFLRKAMPKAVKP